MIPWIKPKIWGNEKQHLNTAFDSTWFSSGSYVEALESQLQEIHGIGHAITTCNGTASIYLILDALGIGHGDQVIVPGFAFGAAANVVSSIGAEPIFCDVDPNTFLIDPEKYESILSQSDKVKAVIPVHSYGSVCEMNTICQISKKYKVWVIEDAAESLFSKYEDRYAGTFGIANSFSLQTTKTITTGEGGFVLTESEELSQKMRLIRSHGMGARKYFHVERGNNFRLSNLLASIGCAQLEHWQKNIEMRDQLYRRYCDLYQAIDGIALQKINFNVSPVMWAFPIYLNKGFSDHSRDELIERLNSKGIETRPGFYTFSQMGMYDAPALEVSENLSANIICLPFYLDLTEEEILYIHKEFLSLKR